MFEQCADVHMVSDSEGDDFEDASEFGVDESEMFGMGTSTGCRKAPLSTYLTECDAATRFKKLDLLFINLLLSQCFLLSAVPENTENEVDALLHFTAEFTTR